jgi:hypothetical protein
VNSKSVLCTKVNETGSDVPVEPEDLFEMGHLYPSTTGLPVTVWVSPCGNAQHDVRVRGNVTDGDQTNIANARRRVRTRSNARSRNGVLMAMQTFPPTPDIGPDPDWEEFAPDSPLEGTGFEPSVPRDAPGVVVVPVPVRADFSLGRESSRGEMNPSQNPGRVTRYRRFESLHGESLRTDYRGYRSLPSRSASRSSRCLTTTATAPKAD